MEPKSLPKSIQKIDKISIEKILENWYQNTPKMEAQRHPQTTLEPTISRPNPDIDQGTPKGSQNGAKREPKGCQKGAQREPKGSPNPTKIDPKWSQKPRAHGKPRKASRRRGKTQKISRGDPKYIKIVTKCNENGAKMGARRI